VVSPAAQAVSPAADAESSENKIGCASSASHRTCLEAAIPDSKGYKTGVTMAVTPVLSLGFCGAKDDARYSCGQQTTGPTNRKLPITK
jgi:hypothetical protein